MGKKIIGIELGTSNTKILIGQNNKTGFNILDYEIIQNTDGMYNYNGELNINELQPILFQFLKEKKVRNKECHLTITSTKTIVRNRSFPKVRLKELSKMVEFEAEQFLPYDMSSFYIDFRVIGEIVNGEEELLNVMVVAVPKNIIDESVALIEKLKLKLATVDILTNSLYNFYLNYISDDKSNVLLADIGSSHIRMITFRGREYFANIVSEKGIGNIIEYYFENFGVNKDEMYNYMFNNGSLKLEVFKKIDTEPTFSDFGALNFSSENSETETSFQIDSKEDYSHIFSEIRNAIIKEILKMNTSFQRREKISIDKVVLYGNNNKFSDIVDIIEQKTEIETIVITEKNIDIQEYYLDNLVEKSKTALIIDIDRDKFQLILYNGEEYFANLMSGNNINEIINANSDGINSVDNIYNKIFLSEKEEKEFDIDYSPIIKEINKMITFFRSRKYDSNINKIYICGGGANSKFIRESIEAETEIPTFISNFGNIDIKDYSILVPMIGTMVGR